MYCSLSKSLIISIQRSNLGLIQKKLKHLLMSNFNPNKLLAPLIVSGVFLLPPTIAEAKGNFTETKAGQNPTEIVLAETTLKQDVRKLREASDKKIYPPVNKVYMGGKKKVKEGANYLRKKYEEHQDKKFDRQYKKRIERLRK